MRFQDLIDRHHDELFRYLVRLTHGSTLAGPEDLVQSTFERAYRGYPRLKSHDNLRAWLYKIATNCALDELRRTGRGDQLALNARAQLPSPGQVRQLEEQLLNTENGDWLRAAIESLPAMQRSALILRYLDELTYQECAQVLGSKPGTVRANVYHALRRLRAEYALLEKA